MSLVLGVSPDAVNGKGLNIAFAVVVGIILVVVVVAALRRQRDRRELGGGGRWWRGQHAPPDKPLDYQRRDDSGQG
jgi:hypothetical protein